MRLFYIADKRLLCMYSFWLSIGILNYFIELKSLSVFMEREGLCGGEWRYIHISSTKGTKPEQTHSVLIEAFLETRCLQTSINRLSSFLKKNLIERNQEVIDLCRVWLNNAKKFILFKTPLNVFVRRFPHISPKAISSRRISYL